MNRMSLICKRVIDKLESNRTLLYVLIICVRILILSIYIHHHKTVKARIDGLATDDVELIKIALNIFIKHLK